MRSNHWEVWASGLRSTAQAHYAACLRVAELCFGEGMEVALAPMHRGPGTGTRY